MSDSTDRPDDNEPNLSRVPTKESVPDPRSSSPVPRRKSSWKPLILVFVLSGFFFVVFVVASFTFFSKGVRGKSRTAARALFSRDAVGLLEIDGVIMDSKKALKTLKKYEENPEVKAIVVRVNSPGGAVAPSQEIHDAIKNFPRPKVVSMGSVAASGGYYVSVAADQVFANPGSITGSIGVIMEFANLEKLYDWAKIKRFSIKTGKYKDSGAEYREMRPDERELLQGMVDDVLYQFKAAVAAGRKMTMEEVTPLADGRIFSGSQAKNHNLVDELGGIDEAVAAAGKLAGIQGKPRIITDEKKKNPFEIFRDLAEMDEGSEGSSSSSRGLAGTLSALIERTVAHALGIGGVAKTVLQPGVYWIWKGAL